MKVTCDNNWEYTDVHIDIDCPYQEDYQMRMLGHNEIPGILRVKGTGRDGSSRYTYRVRNAGSMQKRFSEGSMRKEDVERFVLNLIETVEGLRNHLLDPDNLILMPELIFIEKERYLFCYLPAAGSVGNEPLCTAFHTMTEYFVQQLDYQDKEGILFTYKIHKETLRENYDLKSVIESCRKEELWAAGQSEQKKQEKVQRNSLPEDAIFSLNEEEEEDNIYRRNREEKLIREKPGRYHMIRKAVNRMKTGRWGEWDDLITEMDGQE